jgi:hypothetical protein
MRVVIKLSAMAQSVSPVIPMNNYTPTHDEIAAHAYQIYLREGCRDGCDMDNWLRAESELRERAQQGAQPRQVAEPSMESSEKRTGASTSAAKESGSNGRANGIDTAAAVLPNSVVPPTAPVAQVSRTTGSRKSGKREPALAK